MQMTLDQYKAQIDKENGMNVAYLNSESNGDLERFEPYFRSFIKSHEYFMAEDIKKYALDNGMPNPKNWNFLGGVMRKAAKNRLIVDCGYAKRRSDKSHAGVALAWRRA